MTKLTAKARKSLPKSVFGIPKERKYPMEDTNHAKNAKARASAQVNKGTMSKDTERKLDAKADKVIKENKPTKSRTIKAIKSNK